MENDEKSDANIAFLWKKDVDERLLPKEETKALWEDIFDKFESKSGGEPLARAYIQERLDSLESRILSKIEEIKKQLPED
ncbi:MAG TPA: hypothetical protein VN368_02630 [Candidatus Methylomirabilis sp.]|nr:hypothetical protein [Candidatus Methylomirabilis sp.]